MEINVSVQYNGGLLPDIMLSTRCNYIKCLGTVKASTRMILVHVVQKIDVQNMYRRCTIYLEYLYSERECKGAGTYPCMEINLM